MALKLTRNVSCITRSVPRITSGPSLKRHRSVAASNDPSVKILEVGPRDGLQNIKTQVPTGTKVELIRRLADAGLNAIEATSFVAPKWVPQLADSQDVMREVVPLGEERSIHLPVLTPNIKGFERAAEAGAKEAVVFASASEGFSWKNTNCSIEDGLKRAEEVVTAARAKGLRARGVISCIFACPYDGPTDPAQVLMVARRFLQMGCYEVGLGDTLGVGTPWDTQTLLRVLLSEIPADKLAGHYHDTYGQGVSNVSKSYEMGIRSFDSSVAGLGGCPYAKGATGNVATEDIVYMFEKSGVPTGVDLEKLAAIGDWMSREVGVKNSSRAGPAIVAKSKSESATTAKRETEAPEKPEWNVISDTGEHRVSRSGNTVKLTLTRTQNRNALSNSMVDGITKLVNDLTNDPTVFNIVLDAEGKSFCSGLDLSSSGSAASNNQDQKDAYYEKIEALFSSIANSPKTTIAVVDGPCYGGGVGLAFACDIRLVSANARFTMTEIKLGLSPATISRHMIREWGIPLARETMLSGREVTPTELRAVGAVHGIARDSDDLQDMAEKYLQNLKNCAPGSATACKELVRLGWTDPGGLEQSRYVKELFRNMMLPGSEGEHGMQQFRAKNRKVDWAAFHEQKAAA